MLLLLLLPSCGLAGVLTVARVPQAGDMRLSYYLRPGEEDSDAEQSEPPPEGKELCGTLPLAGAEICVDRKSRTDFKLRHGSWRHDYLLRAADGRERSLWIAALRLDAAQF